MKPTNIEEIKTNIECSLSSVYSKDDVLNIITMVESFKNEEDPTLVKVDIGWLKEKMLEVKEGIDDIEVDESDVEIGMNGRELFIEYVKINGKDDVEDLVCDIIRDLNQLNNVNI